MSTRKNSAIKFFLGLLAISSVAAVVTPASAEIVSNFNKFGYNKFGILLSQAKLNTSPATVQQGNVNKLPVVSEKIKIPNGQEAAGNFVCNGSCSKRPGQEKVRDLITDPANSKLNPINIQSAPLNR